MQTINCISWWDSLWKYKNKNEIKNGGLIYKIKQLMEGRKVQLFWVKGHAGNHYNDIADALSRQGQDKESPFKFEDYIKKEVVA